MIDDQIKHMTDRFLMWRLPDNFNPDNGISYTPPARFADVYGMPIGTNLFDAAQAEAMVRHMVEGMPLSATEKRISSRRKRFGEGMSYG